jgi:hypothetical protein
VRLVIFAILATGVRAFECARNSFTSALVYSRRTGFFVFFLDFFATCCSLIYEAALLPQNFHAATHSNSEHRLYSCRLVCRFEPIIFDQKSGPLGGWFWSI